MIGIGDTAPPGLSHEAWLNYHPEFTSKIVGYTAGGSPIYQGVSAGTELAEVNAWAAYTGAVYNPSNLLATNVGAVPAFAGALVLPSVAIPPRSVPAQTHSAGTQQVNVTTPSNVTTQNPATASVSSTNATAQVESQVTQASGVTTAVADTSSFGISGLEIMIGILGLGIALIAMRKGK